MGSLFCLTIYLPFTKKRSKRNTDYPIKQPKIYFRRFIGAGLKQVQELDFSSGTYKNSLSGRSYPPPATTFSISSGRSSGVALPTSTRTSTNRIGKWSEGLPSAVWLCGILFLLDGAPKNLHLVCIGAIKRRDIAVADCQEPAMQNSAPHISSPLLTEKQTALYLRRSLSSLRRDRKNGTGPGFVRFGRSVRCVQSELG